MSEKIPNLDAIFTRLGMGEPDDAWRSAWERSQAFYRPENLDFLDPATVGSSCRWIGMSEEILDAFLDALPSFRANEYLCRLAWHFHSAWFRPELGIPDTPTPQPSLDAAPAAAMLYAFVFLSGLPYIRARHSELGVDENVTRDTLSDLERWIRKFRQREKALGFSETQWLRRHFSSRIYKLGRLQFELAQWPTSMPVLAHQPSGNLLILADEGMRFTPEGRLAAESDESAWTATRRVADGLIRGNPIDPVRGLARREPVEIAESEWKSALEIKDTGLSIHIPEAGPMDHAECGKSMRRALEFFPRHHPEWPVKAFLCFSWLLDAQFEDYLAPESNIVRFMREFYLFPSTIFSGPIGSFANIFDGYTGDLSGAPQRTSLQRATRKHLEQGKHWHVGGALLMPEHLDWGAEVYRRAKKPPII